MEPLLLFGLAIGPGKERSHLSLSLYTSVTLQPISPLSLSRSLSLSLSLSLSASAALHSRSLSHAACNALHRSICMLSDLGKRGRRRRVAFTPPSRPARKATVIHFRLPSFQRSCRKCARARASGIDSPRPSRTARTRGRFWNQQEGAREKERERESERERERERERDLRRWRFPLTGLVPSSSPLLSSSCKSNTLLSKQ